MSPTDEDFAETRLIEDVVGLRQGDVILWTSVKDETATDPWRRYGCIVTADCDIVQGKHGDVLSYVPLLATADYVRLFVFPKMLQVVLKPKLEQLKSTVRKLQQTHQPAFPEPLSDMAIESWLRENGPEEVLHGLGVPDGTEREEARTIMSNIVAAWEAEKNGTYSKLLDAIVSMRGGDATHKKNVMDAVRNKFRDLPGDAFFIGKIAGVQEQGFVAYLRLVREVSISAVATRTSELSRPTIAGRRIARLTAPYVYRLTQQLGEVFSAIGLPQHYEDSRIRVVDAMLKVPSSTDKPGSRGSA